MRRQVVTTAVIAAVAGIGFADPASAADSLKPDCPSVLIQSANRHRHIVVKKHGVRAAGRNIVKYGVIRRNQHASPARCKEVRKYRKQLKVLHTEPKYHPLIVRTASKPYTAPAGAMTPTVSAGSTLQAIANCESGTSGGYGAVSADGTYRGAYQFDYQTWQSVGGTGDPAAASPSEQDKRAAILYSQRGASAWPVCGR